MTYSWRQLAPALATGAAGVLAAVACQQQPEPKVPAPVAPSPSAPATPPPKDVPDYSKLPDPGSPKPWTAPVPEVMKLSNGIEVWFHRQGETPLVALELIIGIGTAADPPGASGLSDLMLEMLDEGAGSKDALAISDELELLATDYDVAVNVDALSLSMEMLADKLDPSLALLADFVQRPKFGYADFQRVKKQAEARALSYQSTPSYGRKMALHRGLFGRGYLGEIANGRLADIERAQLWRVRQQYRAMMQPDVATFVVVGNVDREALKSALEKHFGAWQGKATAKPADLENAPAPALYLVDYPGASQSSLAIAQRADRVDTDEFYPAMVFNRGFGEAFTGRINMNLREDKGYTYGARSQFQRHERSGYFYVAADVKSSTTRASIDEVFAELEAVCGQRPYTQKERDEAVTGLLLGLAGRFEQASGAAYLLSELPVFERQPDWYSKWPAKVQAVDLQGARSVAREYCNTNDFSVVVAGDRESVEPTLAGLPLPLVVLDREGKQLERKEPLPPPAAEGGTEDGAAP